MKYGACADELNCVVPLSYIIPIRFCVQVSIYDPILFHPFPHGCDITKRDHDDVIKWNHFPRYWPFVRGNRWSPVNSPHKGQWRGALMFSLICAWITGWANNREAGDLRRHRAHYDAIVVTGHTHAIWPEHWDVNIFNYGYKMYCTPRRLNCYMFEYKF